jgi:hypothetical protein
MVEIAWTIFRILAESHIIARMYLQNKMADGYEYSWEYRVQHLIHVTTFGRVISSH